MINNQEDYQTFTQAQVIYSYLHEDNFNFKSEQKKNPNFDDAKSKYLNLQTKLNLINDI